MPKSWIRISRDDSIRTKAEDGHEYFQGYEIRKPEIDYSILDDADIDEIFMLQAAYHYFLTQDEFLSLDGKTQVLNLGVEDRSTNITTRLGHDMQVSQNAMRIALILSQKQTIIEKYRNVLLAQIMGLAHDIGHAPYGHVGETAINEYLEQYEMKFSHSAYGAQLAQIMIDDIVGTTIDIGNEHVDLRDDEVRGFFDELKAEVARGVEKHSTYYSSAIKDETIPQKATRLADGISYMVSDLSDLLRAKPPIITRKTLEDAYNSLGFKIEDVGDLSFDEILDKLEEGGDSLRDLQRVLLSESFSRNRVFDDTVITDDYKLLMDIKSFYPPIISAESSDAYFKRVISEMSKEDKRKVVDMMSQYYKYMVEMKGDKRYNEYLYNDEFATRMGEIINEYREEFASGKSSTKEELYDRIVGDKRVFDSIQSKIRDIERIESITSPTIMALFAIQNRIQYHQILRDGEGKDLNNNQEQSREKIRNMLDRVTKYAFAAFTRPEEFCIDGLRGDINIHNGRRVPSLPEIRKLDTPRYTRTIIEYATFVVQQMQNKDFETEESKQEIINKVMDELGIRKEKAKEIEEIDPQFDIMYRVKAQATSKVLYRPKDIPFLARSRKVTFEEFTDLSERTLSEVSDFIEDPSIRINGAKTDRDWDDEGK